jgi:hypothetical protein
MKTRHLDVGLLLSAFPMLACGQPCGGPGEPSCSVYPVAVITYDLAITDVSPQPAVEHSQISVKYSLVLSRYAPAGKKVDPVDEALVCAPNSSGCVKVTKPQVGRTYTGQLNIEAPAAGAKAPVKIVLLNYPAGVPGQEFTQPIKLAEAEYPVPISALYDVTVDSFTVHHTRAVNNDTIKIDLRASVAGQPSASEDACQILGPPTYCVTQVPQGDVNDGVHQAKGVRVGQYELVPDVSPSLVFAYNVMNIWYALRTSSV